MEPTNNIVPRRIRAPLNMKDGRQEVQACLIASRTDINQTGKLSHLEIRPDGINLVIDLPGGEYVILDLVYPEIAGRMFETGRHSPVLTTTPPDQSALLALLAEQVIIDKYKIDTEDGPACQFCFSEWEYDGDTNDVAPGTEYHTEDCWVVRVRVALSGAAPVRDGGAGLGEAHA